MNKKNLLIVTSTFPRWKNDTDPPFVFELAKRLANHFTITVLTPNYTGSLSYENMEGISVHRFRYFLKSFEKLAGSEGILPTLKRNKLYYLLVPFFILAEFLALLQLIRKNKPDIIHAHWILPQGLIASLVHKLTGVPFVLTTHGGDIYGLQGKFAAALKGYALKNASIVTVVSKDIQKTVKKKYGKDIQTEVISMGVDSSLFHPHKNDPEMRGKYGIKGPFLLYVGRLSEKKGVRYLLEAMPLVLKHFPDCKLLIVGTGELKRELGNLAESLDLIKTGNVVFVGAVPNNELPSYFASADIFIGPSVVGAGGDTEGFGLTFVEAAMSGCIVVGTNVGGISDIIRNEETGFVVPEKNPQVIAEILVKIVQDPSQMSTLKHHAREQMIQKFDWKHITDQYADILKDNALQ